MLGLYFSTQQLTEPLEPWEALQTPFTAVLRLLAAGSCQDGIASVSGNTLAMEVALMGDGSKLELPTH